MTLKQKWYWSEIENQSWTLINHIEPSVVLDEEPPELSDWIMFELWTFVDFDQLGLNRWLHQPGPWTGDEETTGAGSITSTGRTRFTDTHLLQSRAERNYCSYWLMCTQYSAKKIIYKSFYWLTFPSVHLASIQDPGQLHGPVEMEDQYLGHTKVTVNSFYCHTCTDDGECDASWERRHVPTDTWTVNLGLRRQAGRSGPGGEQRRGVSKCMKNLIFWWKTTDAGIERLNVYLTVLPHRTDERFRGCWTDLFWSCAALCS